MFGVVQRELLRRVGLSPYGLVMPCGARERRAVRRLVKRGTLEQATGWPGAYRLICTERR